MKDNQNKMPDLLKRVIFGALFVAITCFFVLFLEGAFCTFYMFLCCIIMLGEFMKMFKMPTLDRILVTIIGAYSICAVELYHHDFNWAFIPLLVLILTYFLVHLFINKTKQEDNLGKSFLALIYIALPFCIATYLSHIDYQMIMAIFLLIWMSDSMAYLVGCKFGKHKIFERISPKKSWEGAIGGFVFTVASAAALGGILFPKMGFDVWQRSIVGAIVGVVGILGDFIESMFKRSAGVKDAGKIIPGHGGLLDRLDSFIFTIPWVAIAVWLIRTYWC